MREYTTIQITKELNKHISKFCKEKGLVASTITEHFWTEYISSSGHYDWFVPSGSGEPLEVRI